MNVFNDIEKINLINSKFILTIGNFDGFHKGHIEIINHIKDYSNKLKLKKAVITFKNKPSLYFEKEQSNINIIPFEDKIEKFFHHGFDYIFALDFNSKIREISREQFLKILLKNKNFRGIVVGENFRFGKDRKGDINYLKESSIKYGFFLDIVRIKFINGIYISSTYIREKIKQGDLSINRYLIEPFYVKGKVEKGKRLGSSIGYPTANIYKVNQLIPKDGVYFTISEYNNKKYFSMTFIGHQGHIETHLLNFNKNLYEKYLKVYFLKFLRKNRKLNSFEELKILLDNDRKFLIDCIIQNKTVEELFNEALQSGYIHTSKGC